jgi:hypothetical protein
MTTPKLAAIAAVRYKSELYNLLARIHGDGGHYIHAHGHAKAVADAHDVWARLVGTADAATARAESAERERDPVATCFCGAPAIAGFVDHVVVGAREDWCREHAPASSFALCRWVSAQLPRTQRRQR